MRHHDHRPPREPGAEVVEEPQEHGDRPREDVEEDPPPHRHRARSRERRVTAWNPAAEAMYGWSEADILRMSPARRRAYLDLLGN